MTLDPPAIAAVLFLLFGLGYLGWLLTRDIS